mmetsp:Transcript_10443/g.17280  ORF Transcript_10443/g.17280 Transcript_10443/m.17280 type:complete len:81 (+) Transcript_10443:45-287(+)
MTMIVTVETNMVEGVIDQGIETKGEIVDEGQDHGQEALEIAEVLVVVEETDIIEEDHPLLQEEERREKACGIDLQLDMNI